MTLSARIARMAGKRQRPVVTFRDVFAATTGDDLAVLAEAASRLGNVGAEHAARVEMRRRVKRMGL